MVECRVLEAHVTPLDTAWLSPLLCSHPRGLNPDVQNLDEPSGPLHTWLSGGAACGTLPTAKGHVAIVPAVGRGIVVRERPVLSQGAHHDRGRGFGGGRTREERGMVGDRGQGRGGTGRLPYDDVIGDGNAPSFPPGLISPPPVVGPPLPVADEPNT